jgi:hypothetical protein
MIGRTRKVLNIAFLLMFLLVSSGICFFHTEKPGGHDPFCPACKFQNSTVATAHFELFQLPVMTVSETIRPLRPLVYRVGMRPRLAARAPPFV